MKAFVVLPISSTGDPSLNARLSQSRRTNRRPINWTDAGLLNTIPVIPAIECVGSIGRFSQHQGIAQAIRDVAKASWNILSIVTPTKHSCREDVSMSLIGAKSPRRPRSSCNLDLPPLIIGSHDAFVIRQSNFHIVPGCRLVVDHI